MEILTCGGNDEERNLTLNVIWRPSMRYVCPRFVLCPVCANINVGTLLIKAIVVICRFLRQLPRCERIHFDVGLFRDIE